jgi:hypothetical protein
MKIYVAHTYGRRHGLNDLECEINTLKSIAVGRKLIRKGHNPFIPNLYHYVHKGFPDSPEEDKWFEIVSEWVQYCDALLVAELPEWEGSGVGREIRIAQTLNIPVYFHLEDIPNEP